MIDEIIERWNEQMQVLIDFDNDEDFWRAELKEYAKQKQIEVLKEMRIDKGLSMEQVLTDEEKSFNRSIENKISEIEEGK